MDFITQSQLNSYGTLLFSRPPKLALYRYILSGTEDEIFRKKYSFVVDYPVNGSVRVYPGSTCTIFSGSITYYVISNFYPVPEPLNAYPTVQEFFNAYPDYTTWEPTQLPNLLWIALPTIIIDYEYY